MDRNIQNYVAVLMQGDLKNPRVCITMRRENCRTLR